eukprot:s259_g41.t2
MFYRLLTEEEKSCQGSWTQPGVVFATSKSLSMRQAVELDPWMLFREEEGLTLILPKDVAEKHDLAHEGPFCRISLMVHSSLEAVGLTAAVAKALSDAQLSANVVAAFHHDHIYVPAPEAPRAVEVLKSLAEKNMAMFSWEMIHGAFNVTLILTGCRQTMIPLTSEKNVFLRAATPCGVDLGQPMASDDELWDALEEADGKVFR